MPDRVEVSVLFCGDEMMLQLNHQYRGIDQTTDVLSFSQYERPGSIIDGRSAARPLLLGDIVISVPQAWRQARAGGHSLRTELEWLILHGALHLMGWDDSTPEELEAMKSLQLATLVLLQRPLPAVQPTKP